MSYCYILMIFLFDAIRYNLRYNHLYVNDVLTLFSIEKVSIEHEIDQINGLKYVWTFI